MAELLRKTFSNVSNASPGNYQYDFCLSMLSEVIGMIIIYIILGAKQYRDVI